MLRGPLRLIKGADIKLLAFNLKNGILPYTVDKVTDFVKRLFRG
jgi:hypothetical protein